MNIQFANTFNPWQHKDSFFEASGISDHKCEEGESTLDLKGVCVNDFEGKLGVEFGVTPLS